MVDTSQNNKSEKPTSKNKLIIVVGFFVSVTLLIVAGFYAWNTYQDKEELNYAEEHIKEANEILGNLYKDGTTDNAIATWESEIEKRQDVTQKADAYYQLGVVYIYDKQPQLALETFQKVIDLNSEFSNFTLYDSMAWAAEELGGYGLAISYYQDTLKYYEEEYSDAPEYEVVKEDYIELIKELESANVNQ